MCRRTALPLLLGWPSMSSWSSKWERPSDCEKPAAPSSSRLPIGDQPATLPAMTPAMAAAGPNAELERERPMRRRWCDLRESGVGGALSSPASSLFGVVGSELVREGDREGEREELLLDLPGMSRSGCWSLNLRAAKRPPRSFLRNVNSSLMSSSAGNHSYCRSSSSETKTLGAAFRFSQDGMHFRMRSSGMSRRAIPTGIERNPNTIEYIHCAALSRWTAKALPPTKTIMICPATMMNCMPMKK